MRVVRAANGDGETPAHVAARSGWACLLRFLLDRGADVLAEDARGRDVLQAACERDRPAVVALILAYVQEHGEDHGEIFDEHVSRFKNKTRVRVWSEGVTPAAVRWRALRRALPDVVSAARAGVAFDANRADVEDALELAWFARLGVLDLCGGDEDATGFARDDVSRDVVTRDASNDPALTFKNESTDAFARIDATLRAADEAFKRARRTRFANRRSRGTGDAPLHVAASEARVGAVRVLIRAGADPNLRDEGDAGDAPLHRLARSAVRRSGTANTREAADAARVLLRRGADQLRQERRLGHALCTRRCASGTSGSSGRCCGSRRKRRCVACSGRAKRFGQTFRQTQTRTRPQEEKTRLKRRRRRRRFRRFRRDVRKKAPRTSS